jgi:hypothetical protein
MPGNNVRLPGLIVALGQRLYVTYVREIQAILGLQRKCGRAGPVTRRSRLFPMSRLPLLGRSYLVAAMPRPRPGSPRALACKRW